MRRAFAHLRTTGCQLVLVNGELYSLWVHVYARQGRINELGTLEYRISSWFSHVGGVVCQMRFNEDVGFLFTFHAKSVGADHQNIL